MRLKAEGKTRVEIGATLDSATNKYIISPLLQRKSAQDFTGIAINKKGRLTKTPK